jgi:quercetin dioxygenase-like cupin family protein
MTEQWHSRAARPEAVPLAQFGIEAEVQRLKAEPVWQSGSRNAITLTKEPGLRVVLTVLRKGTRLHEHQAGGPLTLQVVSGRLGFHAAGRSLTLSPGEVVVLEGDVAHEVEAIEEAAFLLTLAPAA